MLKSQELSATVRVAVEARDREPCVWGVSRASAGRKSAPPIPAVLLAVIQKGLFSASVRAAQLGREGDREGGKEEDRRASRQWGKPALPE